MTRQSSSELLQLSRMQNFGRICRVEVQDTLRSQQEAKGQSKSDAPRLSVRAC